MIDPSLVRKLLARPEDQFQLDERGWQGQTVLVTGAAGFIGSELCGRLLGLHPARIVALDHSEERLSDLLRDFASALVEPELADVRDSCRIEDIFRRVRPKIIIHAAAYKHVSLLEQFPFETLENNTLATSQLLTLAERYEAERFLFVSTDKAVAPASIMGASKRLAEILLTARDQAAVQVTSLRCGNVLGSSGSVLPIWFDQIAKGGPLTVSNPNSKRFFVHVSEAVGALLTLPSLAGAYGLFTYNLHEPVSMGDLAQRLMLLTRQVPVAETGLKPGEKMSEDLLSQSETLAASSCPHISRIESKILDPADLLARLTKSCEERNLASLLCTIRRFVPDYTASSIVESSRG